MNIKKIIIVFAILFSVAATGHAQFFIEGILSMTATRTQYTIGNGIDEIKYTNKDTDFIINATPKVGYQLNDRMALGVSVSYIRGTTKKEQIIDYSDGSECESEETKFPQYHFSVFSRYQLFRMKKFSVLAESSIEVGTGKSDSSTRKPIVYHSVGILLLPMLSYDLSDRISILTSSDFLRMHLIAEKSNNKETGLKLTNYFGGFNSQSVIFSYLGDVRIGFMYKF